MMRELSDGDKTEPAYDSDGGLQDGIPVYVALKRAKAVSRNLLSMPEYLSAPTLATAYKATAKIEARSLESESNFSCI